MKKSFTELLNISSLSLAQVFYREAAEGAKASPSLNVHGAEVTSCQVEKAE